MNPLVRSTMIVDVPQIWFILAKSIVMSPDSSEFGRHEKFLYSLLIAGTEQERSPVRKRALHRELWKAEQSSGLWLKIVEHRDSPGWA